MILPGSTIGILGGGQLARMMILEARRMGYRTVTLDPDPDAAGAQIADERVVGGLSDCEKILAVARMSDVVTLDSEHIPAAALRVAESQRLLRPHAGVLECIQDRLSQRLFLEALTLPQAKFISIDSDGALTSAVKRAKFPAVLKTRRSGYDGKGQRLIAAAHNLADAWESLGRVACILEEFVTFEREVSVVMARSVNGEVMFYPPAENTHRKHVLHISRMPASLGKNADWVAKAKAISEKIATSLSYIGVLTVEFFLKDDGHLLINEIAPRTHNSGHATFGACLTSQFEQHVRAVCGLKLGPSSMLACGAIINLLGEFWLQSGGPPWSEIFQIPEVTCHIYGKKEARLGRKMGHILVTAQSEGEVDNILGRLSKFV